MFQYEYDMCQEVMDKCDGCRSRVVIGLENIEDIKDHYYLCGACVKVMINHFLEQQQIDMENSHE